MGRLDGRRALVTGGSRGLGAAVCRTLAGEGAYVGVLGRDEAAAAAVAAEVDGTPLVADVADAAAVAAALASYGDVDVLVANAGVVWPLGRFVEVGFDEWERAIAVNLVGAARIIHAVLPGMLARGWGRVVTVSSGAARPPGMPSANAYSASKAALDMVTLSLARELDGTGVTANAVRPGVVDTGMQDYMRSLPRSQVGQEFHDRFHGLHQRGELVDAATSAGFLVDVLCGDGNGQVLDIRDAR